MKKKYFPFLFLLCFNTVYAQNWLKDMYDSKVNFFTVQHEFNDWWKIHGPEILKDNGNEEKQEWEAWRIYKRWEQNVAPLMLSRNGERFGTFNQAEADYYAQSKIQKNLRSSADWSYIGPHVAFDDGGGDSCAGRLNCVRFDPNNPATIYVGAPSGGIWKSQNFGENWQLLNTDNLAQIGVSDIAINPQNSNTIYIATGDIANGACFSIGVLKSVDGGATWNTTGLNWTVSLGFEIARLLISPLDSNTLFAATNQGIFKTINGGQTWSSNTNIYNLFGMEFNPANPGSIYTWGYQLYKSVDTGSTWRQLTNGLPDDAASSGFAIGLTPADTACVYVLVSDTSDGGSDNPVKGIYRSLDAGNSFQLQSSNTGNLSLIVTQGLYDLTIAVSPLNKDQLVIGAVYSAFSGDGGVTWASPYYSSHVDHHDIRFYPGSNDTVFSANDGGLFISTDKGNTWAGLNNGIHIGQIYNVSSGSQTKYLYLTGRQDDGTLLQNLSVGTIDTIVGGGDGMKCLIDPSNENNMFYSSEYGFIVNSLNGGYNVIAATYGGGVNGMGDWNTPYALDPENDQTIYVAKDYVYQSTDGGYNWNTLNSPSLDTGNYFGPYYITLAIAPTNSNYIYAGTYNNLYRSTDGGNTFTNITAGIEIPLYCVTVSETNPNEIWVGTYGPHIYKSLDAGTSWTDFSTGLPLNSPFYVHTIASVKSSPDALYAGLFYAGGVYYRDSTLNQWLPFSNGLPNATVNQLEVDYCSGKIRAATYGRDLWESDPYMPLVIKPVASANYSINYAKCTDTVYFADESYFNPTSRQWYFPGGQPVTSTSQNPAVVYPDNGAPDTAFLVVANATGSDTAQYFITTSICTGLSQLPDNSSLSIVPNPNNGNFIISLSNPGRGKVTYAIYDNIGREVYEFYDIKNADILTHECVLSQLSKGIYFIHVISDGINIVQKLVISN